MLGKEQKEQLATLLCIPESAWDSYFFSQDLLARKISVAEQKEMSENAKECGREQVSYLREKYPDSSLEKICSLLQVQVTYRQDEIQDAPKRIVFATFQPPNKIEIYQAVSHALEEVIQQVEDEFPVFQKISISKILLAHEFFHFIEEKNKEKMFTRNKKIESFRLGLFTKRSNVRVLSEIAAMTFAKEWLNLKFSPFLLNYLFACMNDVQLAEQIYLEVQK